MPRAKKNRLIQIAPNFSGFKPQGVHCVSGEDVTITFEEYEALNLCDYELMKQSEAARMMNISRPTFTRIYESARRKVAKAFIEGNNIHFDSGHCCVSEWYRCNHCKISFTLNENSDKCCPICNSPVIAQKI